jgi:hypothetical protein
MAGLLVFLAAAAHAEGTMTLYSCHDPSGRPVGTTGWVKNGGGSLRDECARQPGGSLIAEATDSSPANWVLTAAPGTIFSDFVADACMTSGPFGLTWFYAGAGEALTELRATNGAQSFGCQTSNPIATSGTNITQALFRVLCLGSCEARVRLRAFKATVVDSRPPTVADVRGSLVNSVIQDGAEGVTFNARDVGVGVYRTVARIRDRGIGTWRDVKAAPVATAGPCTAFSDPGKLEFTSPQPCPLAVVGASLTLQPDDIPVGEYDLAVVVVDAAGNETPVLTPRPYTVPAPPLTTFPASAPPADEHSPPVDRVGNATQPADATAAAGPSLARLSITSPLGRLASAKAFRVTGRLLDRDGNPIAHARVQIATRGFLPKPRSSFGGWAPLGEAETDTAGEFRAQIPAGASRSIQVTYADVAAQVNLSVPAQITVRARNTRVRNGHSAVLRGRVLGPIPSGGVPVGLEVRDGSRWIPVATTRRWVKTSRTGRFSLTYRFRRTFNATTYRVRVVADEDSASEYARGASHAVDVRVRP